jgi:hypothetical protein
MTANHDISPTLEIIMAQIAKELDIMQDELPPSIEGILFNAMLDIWKKGNDSAHSRNTVPPPRTKTNPSFPSVSEPIDQSEEITKILRPIKKPKSRK